MILRPVWANAISPMMVAVMPDITTKSAPSPLGLGLSPDFPA
jgi:hypothetical protein